MKIKEKAVLSVSADGQPCVSRDTNVNQLASSITSETVKSKKKSKAFFPEPHLRLRTDARRFLCLLLPMPVQERKRR